MPRGRGRGGGPPRPRVHLGKRERRLAKEVLHLHSLWRRGPPAPAPNQSGSGDRKSKTTDHKRRRLDGAAAEPKDTGLPPPNSSPKTSPASTSSPAKPPPPPPPTSPGALAEREALRAAAEFFSKSKHGSGSEGEKDAAVGFLTGLFSRDAALRGHYERSWEEGEFSCLACAAGGRKMGRRFRGCASLVQHARDGSRRNGWPLAHRALARVLGRVLGWNIWKLPTTVIDPRGTLGQALAAGVAADVQQKENDDTGEDSDSSSDEDEEEYGTGEDTDSWSDEDEEEDFEIWMEDSSTDGDEEESELETSEESAEKEDVEKGDEDSKNPDDDGEATELDNSEKSTKKEEMEEIGPSNCKEVSKSEVFL